MSAGAVHHRAANSSKAAACWSNNRATSSGEIRDIRRGAFEGVISQSMTLAGPLHPARFREKKRGPIRRATWDQDLSNRRSSFGERLSQAASRLPIAKPAFCSTQAIMRQEVPAALGGGQRPSVAAPVREELHSCLSGTRGEVRRIVSMSPRADVGMS